MNRLKELKELRAKAENLQLDNAAILRKYNMQQLCAIYNGIGPDSFPDWLRDCISALHPSLAVVALIHDVEWHELPHLTRHQKPLWCDLRDWCFRDAREGFALGRESVGGPPLTLR